MSNLRTSPCIGVCRLQGDTCIGCGRTVAEIAEYGASSGVVLPPSPGSYIITNSGPVPVRVQPRGADFVVTLPIGGSIQIDTPAPQPDFDSQDITTAHTNWPNVF